MNSLQKMVKLGTSVLNSANSAFAELVWPTTKPEPIDMEALQREFARFWLENGQLRAQNESLINRNQLLEATQAEVRVHPETQQHVYAVGIERLNVGGVLILRYRDAFGGYTGHVEPSEWITWEMPQL